MRYPPAITHTLGASWGYRSVACIVATFLIAIYADFVWASDHFSLIDGTLMLLGGGMSLWLLIDAWRKPHGALHFAQGQWHWLQANEETAGTLRLHFDLHNYMLVSFVPHQRSGGFFLTTTQWFHLEARQVDPAAGWSAWLALRRAVHAPQALADEERAA